MRKKVQGRKFGREKDQREALMNGLANSFLLKGKIKTTEAKAKELRPFVEKVISKARKGDLSARRGLLRFLPETTVKKLIEEIAPIYKTRPGGYTRIIKLVPRQSDGARIAIIELIDPLRDNLS